MNTWNFYKQKAVISCWNVSKVSQPEQCHKLLNHIVSEQERWRITGNILQRQQSGFEISNTCSSGICHCQLFNACSVIQCFSSHSSQPSSRGCFACAIVISWVNEEDVGCIQVNRVFVWILLSCVTATSMIIISNWRWQ